MEQLRGQLKTSGLWSGNLEITQASRWFNYNQKEIGLQPHFGELLLILVCMAVVNHWVKDLNALPFAGESSGMGLGRGA